MQFPARGMHGSSNVGREWRKGRDGVGGRPLKAARLVEIPRDGDNTIVEVPERLEEARGHVY